MTPFLRIVAVVSVIIIASCAAYQPRLGMTYQEWYNHWGGSNNWGVPRLVSAQENIEVWTLDDGVFLYFQDNRLFKVNQGQLFQERNQLEIINR